MDMGNHDGDMSMQYGTIHETAAKLKLLGSSGNGTSLTVVEDTRPVKQQAQQGAVRYRECLKNHAASIGGHAVDGCGEFLPCGEEGTLESLKCAACDCHRNFHRREVEGEPSCDCQQMKRKDKKRSISMMMGGGGGRLMGGESDQEGAYMAGGGGGSDGAAGGAMMLMKKRFRTKFSTEQKDKMLNFAEKLGWKIQKHDEADVQQFCSECGIKRQVLKVWMHNNKHTLGKKL